MLHQVAETLMGLGACLLITQEAHADQSGLGVNTAIHGPTLTFDWPAISVGIGSYEEGPTRLIVIRFNTRASVVVDARGGAPRTVNTDALRLGYNGSFTDARQKVPC